MVKTIVLGLVGVFFQMVVMFSGASVFAADAVYPIAGVEPSKRPTNAPFISQYKKDENWYKHALRGVEGPYLYQGFVFLESQGAWSTPFTKPGMLGPYDIRGWHK